MRTLKLLPLFVLGVIALDGSSALAERRNPLAGQPAIRNKIELRKLRFEITPQFLVGLNQDYKHSFGPGANLTFHITDWLGVGIQGSYNFNTNTALEDKVRAQLPNENGTNGMPYMYPGPQPTLQIHDQRVLGIDGLLSAYAQLTPFTGKFALFSAAFFSYDLYADVGLGVVHYKQNCCNAADSNFVNHPVPGDNPPVGDPNTEDPRIFAGWKVGGLIGVGAHVFFNDFIGMQLELRDYIVGANPSGGDVNGDRHLTKKDESVQNNIFFGVGVVVMLPPKAKITH